MLALSRSWRGGLKVASRRFRGGRLGLGAWALCALISACGEDESGGGTPVEIDASVDRQDADETPEVDADLPDPVCSNGRDDDGDGRTDFPADPGCSGPTEEDETGDPPPACANGQDDDGDTLVDLADPGCGSERDIDESDDPAPPACANMNDDDADGYSDFPDDPGCGSEFDDDEANDAMVLPQCGDGQDNDRDGRVDIADPGCVSAADPREADAEGPPPPCSNTLDDDADGIVDFPLDPGCAAAGDEDEADPPTPPACANAEDDDEDGRVDYPDDPGCAGVGDRDETDPAIAPICSDGLDNDRDGRTDYPDDSGCLDAAGGSEAGSCGEIYVPIELEAGRDFATDTSRGRFESEGSCGGRGASEIVALYRLDRALERLRIRTDLPGTTAETTIYLRRACLGTDTEVACAREPSGDGVAGNVLELLAPAPGEYYVFVDGAAQRGGPVTLRIEEVELAACLNQVDDDDDGRRDFPVDPGCERPDDRDEADPEILPACANDEDDDGDGLVDYPLDLGCRAAVDDDEVDVCGQGVRTYDYPVGEPFILDDASMGASNQFTGSCGGANQPEKVYRYVNPYNARLTFSVDFEETLNNTMLYVRTECQRNEVQNGCSTGIAPAQKGRVRIDRAAPGEYFVFVDRQFGAAGAFKLAVDVERLPAGCRDGRDNDGDNLVDGEDLGCAEPDDEDERDPAPGVVPACGNTFDDDEDGVIDFPLEPGCTTRGDEDETDPVAPTGCANGLDDDGDGRIDFPSEPGCQSRGDPDEENPAQAFQCSNRLDDDQDGLTDYPNDPGCSSAGDGGERDPMVRPACSNGEDDDRDGLADYPFDSGCVAAGDLSELAEEGAPVPACSNRMDDDGDGVTDFPREPGCLSAADDDETDPNAAPQCANRRDDDADMRIDFPDDAGCRFAADGNEMNVGPLLARCGDGVDNDDDGFVDGQDLGCTDPRDNDEADPEPGNVPACANELDDDEDDAIDWPADDGCAAQGDPCEEPGYGLCGGACVDLVANEQNCGRCGRVCAAGVECIAGRCGAIRSQVLVCGNTGRNVQNDFIRGELIEAEVRVAQGCRPDDETQAIVVPRSGVQLFAAEIATIRTWLDDGGQILTEYNTSDDIYGQLLGIQIPQGPNNGACGDNVQPVVQFTPDDPFWQDNAFVAIPQNQAGCGFAIPSAQIPDFVPLGGWNANAVSLGYVDVGAGRLWMIEADWSDGGVITDTSKDLFAYMIAGGRRAANGPACGDGRDSDRDGLADLFDPGCVDSADADEADLPVRPVCANGRDDDGDGDTDFPNDLGCSAAGDVDEGDPAVAPVCANARDDDFDGRTDFPQDPGCQAPGDGDEADPPRVAPCSNGRDDDADGATDWPEDPGCASAADLDEANPMVPPVCANGADDDRDGRFDYPLDPGCLGAGDLDEADPARAPACANGRDDDLDGVSDYPDEPGCRDAADDDERNPANRLACSNQLDDDGDGRTDYPDDLGCRAAADDSEVNVGQVAARCADGRDNDRDGLVDGEDLGCEDGRDDDEEDPADGEIPACANGDDDDDDGAIDWPDDDGCAAQGDFCEQPGFAVCNGVCEDLVQDESNCGRCGRVCAPGVECLEGRCGLLRPNVMACGNPGRQVQEFIRGDLADLPVRVVPNCVPDGDTQAMLVTRSGVGGGNGAAWRQYLEDGGVIITEYSVAHSVYNAIFGANVPQGARNGSCQDNVQPVVQFNPNDSFWAQNPFVGIGAGQSGCGHDILGEQMPGFVALGGWDANNISLGYVDVGAGRLWLVEADWQDSEQAFTNISRDYMAAMIRNTAR